MIIKINDLIDNMTDLKEICGICGLTRGSHKCTNPYDQCPDHEGRMDWPKTNMTQFKPTGEYRVVSYGTKSEAI